MFDEVGFRWRGRWVAVVLVLCCWEGRAAAQPAAEPALAGRGKVQLAYTVPKKAAGCDSEATFRKLAANGPNDHPIDPFALTGPPTHLLSVTLAPDRDGFGGFVELRDTAGTSVWSRQVFERTCEKVTDYVVLLINFAVFTPRPRPPPPPLECHPCKAISDVKARLDRLEEKSEAHDATTTVLKKQLTELEKQNAELEKALEDERNKMNLTYTLATGFLMTANLTSNVGPGVWLGGDVRSGPLSVGLELRGVLPSRVVVGPNDLDLSQLVGLLTPCGHISYFFGCGVAGAGVQIDTDSDFPSPDAVTQSHAVLQLGGRIGVEVPFAENRFAIRGWAEVLYSTPTVSFSYGPELRVYRPDVSAFFGLGFVFKFGQPEGVQ